MAGNRIRGGTFDGVDRTRNTFGKGVGRPIKLLDGDGLYLFVQPNCGRWRRFKYHFHGKERVVSLDVYPEVPLKLACTRREDARRAVAQGIDPSAERKAAKESRQVTFELVAEEWLALQAKKLATVTYDKARWMLSTFIYPRLGSRPIAEITAPELLAALRVIESRGTHETAHRTKQRVGQVFRYAIATGRAERDISTDLRGALAPVVTTHHAAITDPLAIGHLLRAIDGHSGQPVTLAALKLAPLVFVRPGELRQAEWSEINFDLADWRIPAARMKMHDTHIVPLAQQAIEILEDLRPLTGRRRARCEKPMYYAASRSLGCSPALAAKRINKSRLN